MGQFVLLTVLTTGALMGFIVKRYTSSITTDPSPIKLMQNMGSEGTGMLASSGLVVAVSGEDAPLFIYHNLVFPLSSCLSQNFSHTPAPMDHKVFVLVGRGSFVT